MTRQRFADLAANERTWLAWIRTGVAVVGLGFVVARFNLFLLALAGTGAGAPEPSRVMRFSGAGLVGAGVFIVAVATWRFFETDRRLRANESIGAGGPLRASLMLLAGAILAIAAFSAWLAFA
jgi:putative membrane protein